MLTFYRRPRFTESTLLLGFSGWMNGGEVSTGTVRHFIDAYNADELAEIDSEGFYINSFPGPMEIAAMFRPHVKIDEGLVKEYTPPENIFYYSRKRNLIIFEGREPHLHWESFADAMFTVCRRCRVQRIFCAGSVGGLTPHTREPTISFSTSNSAAKEKLVRMGLKPVNYEGPAGFISLLTVRAEEEKIPLVSLVAEIPAYVEGYNPRCIETMVRCVARLANLQTDLEQLKTASRDFERKLTILVDKQPDLAEKVKELETDYDRNAFNREMSDLKGWLGQQGIRVE